MKHKIALQFKIELLEIFPIIWRRIEVSSNYSFWDLHIAIQDSMGWLDYHVHEFQIFLPRKRKPTTIGIPHNEYENNTLPGWEVPIVEFFKEPGDEAVYDYDLGDGWQHKLTLEGKYLQKENSTYPNCLEGERACPPEDCGGVQGYYNLLEILANKTHEEHDDMIYWLKNHAKNYYPYEANSFDPKKVKFWNPRKRFKMAFQSS